MRTRRAVCYGLILSAVASAAAPAARDHVTMVEGIDTREFHAPPDVISFILDIASATANAPGGSDSGHRAVTLSRDPDGTLVVNAVQIVSDDKEPTFPAGTVAILMVQRPGECQPPHKGDEYGVARRVFTFVVDHKGQTVWELGAVGGLYSFRLIKGPSEFGPEEDFNIDSSRYRIYPCANYD